MDQIKWEDMSIAVLAIYVLYTVLMKVLEKPKGDSYESMAKQAMAVITENNKVTSELLTYIRQTNQSHEKATEKTNDILSGLVLTVNQLLNLANQSLDKIRELERRT